MLNNDLGLLENTHILKSIEVFMILKKKLMICFIRGRKNHQRWETVLVTKLCLCQQNPKKTH